MKIKVTKVIPHKIGTQARIKVGTVRTVLYRREGEDGIINYVIEYKGKKRDITSEYCKEI
ncbi:hypothetical protein ACV3Z5_13790 [Clostridium perfringens]